MEAVQKLPPYQQQQFMKQVEEMQLKDSLSMYNNLVSRCFDSCITTFRSKSLDSNEISCIENCAGRYVKMTQRVGLRFAEHQTMQQKKFEQQEGAAAAGGSVLLQAPGTNNTSK